MNSNTLRSIMLGAFAFLLVVASPAHADPTTGSVHITVRSGDTIATSSIVTFPLDGTVDVAASDSTLHTIAASSTLAALETLAASSSEFSITDLQYYSSYSAFYLNCLSVPSASASPLCGQWQFTVNGTAPQEGMDKAMLHDGDTVFIYYGYPRRVTLSNSAVTVGQTFIATAQSYDPSSNSYGPATPYTIGITQPDPSDPWNPIEVATSTTDGSGAATFSLPLAGSYNVGIKEDYYSPTVALTVASDTAPAVASGGGAAAVPVRPAVNYGNLLTFLSGAQNSDGSFSNPIITDWAAVALSHSTTAAKASACNYLVQARPSMSSITDFERHSIALEACSIDPSSGTPTDYVAPIVRSFDGSQIGAASQDNDDIFGLIALRHAGYAASDTIIRATAQFVVGKQGADGSWDTSTDLTAAAVQALAPLSSLSGVTAALTHARTYLANQQQQDGGFGNISATAWALQAIYALAEQPSAWTRSGNSPTDYLAAKQQGDGSIKVSGDTQDTAVWESAYTAPALAGAIWDTLLASFSRGSAAPAASGAMSYNLATSTLVDPTIATTTPVTQEIATSTPLLTATTTLIDLPQKATETSATITTKILAPHLRISAKTMINSTTTKSETSSTAGASNTPSVQATTHTNTAATSVFHFFTNAVNFFLKLF